MSRRLMAAAAGMAVALVAIITNPRRSSPTAVYRRGYWAPEGSYRPHDTHQEEEGP